MPTSAAGWGGSGPTSSPPPITSRRSSTPGVSRTGWRGLPRNSPTPGRMSPCSTRPRSRNTSWQVGTPRQRCSGCAPRDIGVPVGRSVYTGMLNERGTYESDVTVTRTGAEEFLIVSSAATTERDKDHIRENLPPDANAKLVDVTSAYAVFGVMGPKSRDLLATPHLCRSLRRGLPVSAPAGKSRSDMRRCALHASPMSAN